VKRQEFLSGAFSSLAVLSVAGCFTPILYETHTYDEAAVAFLVTEDGSRLVVLGEKYHYIFDQVTPSLKQILLSPLDLRTMVSAVLADFYVDTNNVVTGDYVLSLSNEASEEQRRSAIAAGFLAADLTLSGHLKGVRYSAEGFPLTGQTQEFAQRHRASIREGRSKATKILLTPITVAADGALILAGLALMLLMGSPPVTDAR
jgi:hypothetical protein